MMDDATVRTPRASSLRRAEIVFGAKTVSRDQNDEHRDRERAIARFSSRSIVRGASVSLDAPAPATLLDDDGVTFAISRSSET